MILERIEGSRLSRVRPLWDGRRVFIIASGASLTLQQVGLVERFGDGGVIAVNSSFLWAGFADVLYAADSHWHRWMQQGIAYPQIGMDAAEVRRRFEAFGGQKCTIQNSGANVTDEAVHMLRNKEGMGLSRDPEVLVSGRNSGFQAMNLAALAGAKRIVLLGFDGGPAADGREHFHGPHPRPTPREAYPLYRQAMSAAENPLRDCGVEVINCSPGTKIDSFPKAALEDML